MIDYKKSPAPDFSGLEVQSGIIYHQRGGYYLTDSEQGDLIPVNRSYRPVYSYDALHTNPNAPYQKDRLIHDTVPESAQLHADERVLDVHGQRLLFLRRAIYEGEVSKTYSSDIWANNSVSPAARRVGELLVDGLSSRNAVIKVGIHGSHQSRLNGADSDMDFMAWSPREVRAEGVAAFNEALQSLGYVDANTTAKFSEYTTRIARLTGLSEKVGAFLAGQRFRWVSPQGVSTSLQCMHADYNHENTAKLMDALLNNPIDPLGEVVNLKVEVVGQNEPFNFPRTWNIGYGDKEARAVSFNWAHQGMGCDGMSAESMNNPYVLSADRLLTESGEIFFLRNHGHYILPASLMEG